MKRRYDVVYVVILLLFLVIASFIGNAIIKGIMLLLFSAALIFSTVLKLKEQQKEKVKSRIFYVVLLFLEVVLAFGATATIIMAIKDL